MTPHCRSLTALLCFLALFATANAQTAFPTRHTAQLIRLAEAKAQDPSGWALDLHDVLQTNNLEQSRENICAAIAVVDQESGFVADPAVPGLGKLSETALREKLGKVPLGGALALSWLESNPTPQTSFMARIRNARTERDLDLAYRALVQHAGEATSLDLVLKTGLLNKFVEERNDIDTVGSMQVSVAFALAQTRERRWLPMTLNDVYALRDQLYTRHGGLYFGVQQLLGYESGYSQKLFRFADFNAGRYASRNAAFQQVIAALSGDTLALDGDLLRYGKDGKPLKSTTTTELALRRAVARHKLGLDNAAIRRDLLLEKTRGFATTPTFTILREKFQVLRNKPAPFAIVPDIALSSPKLSRGFSTRRFAEAVNKRYQACMKAKLGK